MQVHIPDVTNAHSDGFERLHVCLLHLYKEIYGVMLKPFLAFQNAFI